VYTGSVALGDDDTCARNEAFVAGFGVTERVGTGVLAGVWLLVTFVGEGGTVDEGVAMVRPLSPHPASTPAVMTTNAIVERT
jgi:hypothetical protein